MYCLYAACLLGFCSMRASMRWSVTRLSIRWLNTKPMAAQGSPTASASMPTPIHQSCSPKWLGCRLTYVARYTLAWARRTLACCTLVRCMQHSACCTLRAGCAPCAACWAHLPQPRVEYELRLAQLGRVLAPVGDQRSIHPDALVRLRIPSPWECRAGVVQKRPWRTRMNVCNSLSARHAMHIPAMHMIAAKRSSAFSAAAERCTAQNGAVSPTSMRCCETYAMKKLAGYHAQPIDRRYSLKRQSSRQPIMYLSHIATRCAAFCGPVIPHETSSILASRGSMDRTAPAGNSCALASAPTPRRVPAREGSGSDCAEPAAGATGRNARSAEE